MGDMMPKEQSDFIKKIENYILETTNYGEQRAHELGFEIWQNKKWLKKLFIEDCEKCETDQWDALYKMEVQGKIKGIDECIKAIEESKSLFDNHHHSTMAEKDKMINLLKKLKEQKND